MEERVQWISDFEKSPHEPVRKAAVSTSVLTQDAIDEYYRDRTSVEREQDALESSRNQLRIADQQHTLRMQKRQGESNGYMDAC
jgi:hypothetical protein